MQTLPGENDLRKRATLEVENKHEGVNEMIHTCRCGNEITTSGWNNNINKILRCEDCSARRAALIAQISEAIQGRKVETVYISGDCRDLILVDDFEVEISYRRSEKMNGQAFQIA